MFDQLLLRIQQLTNTLLRLHETACKNQALKQKNSDVHPESCEASQSELECIQSQNKADQIKPEFDNNAAPSQSNNPPGCRRSAFKGEYVCLADIPTPLSVKVRWNKLVKKTFRKLMIATHPDKHPGRTDLFWQSRKAKDRNDLGVLIGLAMNLSLVNFLKHTDKNALHEAVCLLEIQIQGLLRSGLVKN